MHKIQSIRGMNDILPSESYAWQYLEKTFIDLVQSYGYQEIRTPILEKTKLFKRTIGEITDIVEKEMYTFTDRNNDSLSLRPENTASVVRALIEHGLLQERTKCWYFGQMFRHERPQKGRFRQFYQLGCEVFNLKNVGVEAELIAISNNLWQKLQINNVELQINSLGSKKTKQNYCQVLLKFFNQNQDVLDEDSKRRLNTNPLRILDTKNPDMQDLIAQAPKLINYLDDESKQDFDKLCELLISLQISFVINQRLVRGPDYYNKTVFEWVSNELGSQGTICAGGRYDGLVKQIGGNPTPAFGFAIGAERVLSLIDSPKIKPKNPDIYLINQGLKSEVFALNLREKIYQTNPKIKILTNFDGGSFKAQFKRADKSNAKYAFIIGEEEVENNKITIKSLRQKQDQETLEVNQIQDWLIKNFY